MLTFLAFALILIHKGAIISSFIIVLDIPSIFVEQSMSEATTTPVKKHLCEICQAECKLTCGVCKDAWYCSRDHQAKDWKVHKKICLTKADKEDIVKVTKFRCECLENAKQSIGWQEEYEGIKLQRAFVDDHPWPDEERVLQFILSPPPGSNFHDWGYARMMQAPGVYRHSLAARLYQATAIKSFEKQIQEWRSIGYLLHKRGGKEMMKCYYHLVAEILMGDEIWPEERDPEMGYWIFQYVEIYWDKIGAWRW